MEVHLVDLDIGFSPADWTDGLIQRAMPRLLAGLTERADPRLLLAWMLGRGPAPLLEPWG